MKLGFQVFFFGASAAAGAVTGGMPTDETPAEVEISLPEFDVAVDQPFLPVWRTCFSSSFILKSMEPNCFEICAFTSDLWLAKPLSNYVLTFLVAASAAIPAICFIKTSI